MYCVYTVCTMFVHVKKKDRMERESKKTSIKARCGCGTGGISITREAETGESLCLLADQIREL